MAFTRRDLLAGTTAGIVSRYLPKLAGDTVRVAHMTDFHVQPELRAPEGMGKALRHMMALNPRPELILGGGDLIMDSFSADEARTKTQWDIFQQVLKANTDLPFYPALGNHDVWGWNEKSSKTTGKESKWGTRWFLDVFQRDRTYYAFDKGAWRFIVLDNLIRTPDGYNGNLDAAQLDWLKGQVQTTKPVLVLTHIPIFAPCTMVYNYDTKTGDWTVGGNLMTKNFNAVKEIFDKAPNVKICLSGHIHLQDRYDYNGVSYLCGGAVSGNWWNGKYHDFEPGYVTLDLNADGSFDRQFHTWGWTAG